VVDTDEGRSVAVASVAAVAAVAVAAVVAVELDDEPVGSPPSESS